MVKMLLDNPYGIVYNEIVRKCPDFPFLLPLNYTKYAFCIIDSTVNGEQEMFSFRYLNRGFDRSAALFCGVCNSDR